MTVYDPYALSCSWIGDRLVPDIVRATAAHWALCYVAAAWVPGKHGRRLTARERRATERRRMQAARRGGAR